MSFRGTPFSEAFASGSGDHRGWHFFDSRDGHDTPPDFLGLSTSLTSLSHSQRQHDSHQHEHHCHSGSGSGTGTGSGSGTGTYTAPPPPPPSVGAVAAAAQLAVTMQAGVQGQAGETNPPDLSNLPVGDDTAGATIRLTGINNNTTSILGNGDADTLVVDTGDSNILHAGDGTGDQLVLGTGNENDLHAGNGAADYLFVGTGNHNNLSAGDGAGDSVSVGGGSFNSLQAGSGNGDLVSVDGGDNNLLSAGDGANDYLTVNIGGNHNTLHAGAGDGDICKVASGNDNLLTAGDGAGDTLFVQNGNDNVLINGNGAGDTVTVGAGDGNVLAVGDGAGDVIELSSGNNNIILVGNGANDTVLVGGAVGAVGTTVNTGNSISLGNGDGDQAWGSLGDGNNYMTGAGNDLVHTGGGADFVYVDNHTEQSAAALADSFHLTTQDSLAQNLFADGGNDTFAIQGTPQGSTSLGTTVMTGGGGGEKYWLSNSWGNAVITDFNTAHGDRVMIGGVSDPDISTLGSVSFQYVHSAYDTANSGNVDLLITFGSTSNTSQSITLIDYQPQDTGGAGGSMQFDGVTYSTPQTAEAALSQIFDFSLADNQAVTDQVAALNAQHLILH